MRLRFWKRKPEIILTIDDSEMMKEIEMMEQHVRVAELNIQENMRRTNDIFMDMLEMLIFGDQDE